MADPQRKVKWEYQVVAIPFFEDKEANWRLNEHGADGWEAIAVVEGANFDGVWYKVVMKRSADV
jgi:hypothetical protein